MSNDKIHFLDLVFDIASLNRELSADYNTVQITFTTDEGTLSITLAKNEPGPLPL